MKDVYKDETANGWILIPATNLVEFVAEEQIVCTTTIKGYCALDIIPGLLGLLHHLPKELAEVRMSLAEFARHAPDDASFAKKEIDAGFPTICAHHTIAVWAAIETTIEQIFTSYLLKATNSNELLLALAPNLNSKKVKTDTLSSAKRAVKMWEATFYDPSNISRALTMLAALGFKANISQQVKQDLDEMSETRNIILHRAGFLDETFLKKCPWFDLPVDRHLKIDQNMMDRYFRRCPCSGPGFDRCHCC